LKNSKVAARVAEQRKLWESGVIVSRPFVQQKLMEHAESEDEAVSMGALKELSKHLGLHKTNVKHTVEGELNHRHLHLEALKMVNGEAKRVQERELALIATRNTDATRPVKSLEHKDNLND
jgi:hypothetical protein